MENQSEESGPRASENESPPETESPAEAQSQEDQSDRPAGPRPYLWVVVAVAVGLGLISLTIEQKTQTKSLKRVEDQSVAIAKYLEAKFNADLASLRAQQNEWLCIAVDRRRAQAAAPAQPVATDKAAAWAKVSEWQRKRAKEAGVPVAREWRLPGGAKGKPVVLRMVYIPPGTCVMGTKTGREYEMPQRKVTLTRGFYLSINEVTQEQWMAVMGTNLSRFQGPDHPVDHVSWNDCQAFLQRLRWMDVTRFRLPTEAEWEYACRASDSQTASGDAAEPKPQEISLAERTRLGWFGEPKEDTSHHPVAQKAPNRWGLYDMIGNVWEWCEDYYGPFSAAAQVDPLGPLHGDQRTTRGGAWRTHPDRGAPAARFHLPPHLRMENLGLRVLAEVPH